MEIVIVKNESAGAELAGEAIVKLLTEKPTTVLGLATGSTPLPVYDYLVQRYEVGAVSFAEARGFALDEYVGLPQGHPESYRAVLDREIVGRVNFAPNAVTTPDGETSCEEYSEDNGYVSAVRFTETMVQPQLVYYM